ncbi:hypothetical protein HK101_010449 [Irineochytrium annulatum]|nr:hypothetical protein HK101_010449 [Irineochytrium annulatum]
MLAFNFAAPLLLSVIAAVSAQDISQLTSEVSSFPVCLDGCLSSSLPVFPPNDTASAAALCNLLASAPKDTVSCIQNSCQNADLTHAGAVASQALATCEQLKTSQGVDAITTSILPSTTIVVETFTLPATSGGHPKHKTTTEVLPATATLPGLTTPAATGGASTSGDSVARSSGSFMWIVGLVVAVVAML